MGNGIEQSTVKASKGGMSKKHTVENQIIDNTSKISTTFSTVIIL